MTNQSTHLAAEAPPDPAPASGPADTPAILADRLTKTFGSVRALAGVSLRVPRGTVLGVLGPNGAGKTTAVRILTTLLKPDTGSATVAGVDVVADPAGVRRRIGLSGQYAAVDEYLTGFENLNMIGRLYHLGRRRARERARELLTDFRLDAAADRPAKTYSGGMRRRLDLAGALVARPPVIFLDEPTTGLDPRSRNDMWEVISSLVADGTTVLLTTQYLEEADRLADNIVVIDHGRVIAEGTADQLKAQVGGARLQFTFTDPTRLPEAASLLAPLAAGALSSDTHNRTLSIPVAGGPRDLQRALELLGAAGVGLDDVGLHRPTLDDVFLTLTGRPTEDAPTTAETTS